ncbi:hypothetical protein HS961_10520 [Comamonas piscis]|uniref:Uncharacterized protein n=1 Tax=Comamonas piscis TaxID=1562974 RepID=A0A7G5EGV1_9BURK|nr:hypothetical protein [Comamonas piscis]QMV73226.1 hypothetical protein HS961_10520 [Comamonas piscis]WSO36018.1 hypothetical protein VUJ63_10555 [Comamonas piscis]
MALYEFINSNSEVLKDPYVGVIITADKVSDKSFEFLNDYSRAYVQQTLLNWDIGDELVVKWAFGENKSIALTVAYLLDRSSRNPKIITDKLKQLNVRLMDIEKLAKRAKWFDDISKTRAAEYIFARRGYIRYWTSFVEHPELFFLDDRINDYEKEALFKDIRARYNLEESRKVNPKRQCNFSIDPKAYILMEKIRKKSGFKKSVFLEIIFSPENEEILHKLVKLKTTPPVIHKPTEAVDWDMSKSAAPPGGFK